MIIRIYSEFTLFLLVWTSFLLVWTKTSGKTTCFRLVSCLFVFIFYSNNILCCFCGNSYVSILPYLKHLYSAYSTLFWNLKILSSSSFFYTSMRCFSFLFFFLLFFFSFVFVFLFLLNVTPQQSHNPLMGVHQWN